MIVPAPNVAISGKGAMRCERSMSGDRREFGARGVGGTSPWPSCRISPDNGQESTPVHRCTRVEKMRTRAGGDSRGGDERRTAALATLAVEPVAKSLAGLEGRHGALGDDDGFAGAGIAALACRTVAGGEPAEACDVDRLAAFECVGDGRDDGVERGGGIGPGQRRAGGDARAELGSVHGFSPVCVRASMFNDGCGVVERPAGADPLIHRSEIVQLEGESCRLREAKEHAAERSKVRLRQNRKNPCIARTASMNH